MLFIPETTIITQGYIFIQYSILLVCDTNRHHFVTTVNVGGRRVFFLFLGERRIFIHMDIDCVSTASKIKWRRLHPKCLPSLERMIGMHICIHGCICVYMYTEISTIDTCSGWLWVPCIAKFWKNYFHRKQDERLGWNKNGLYLSDCKNGYVNVYRIVQTQYS